MKIKIKETLDYRVEIDKVEKFVEGKEYDVSDAVGKSIVSSDKAEEIVFDEAKAEAEAKEQSNIKPEVTKIVEVEEKKEAPKADDKKPGKNK